MKKSEVLELDCSKLPLLIKLKGETGKYVQFILKAAGKGKLGAQLIKPDNAMLQLLGQS